MQYLSRSKDYGQVLGCELNRPVVATTYAATTTFDLSQGDTFKVTLGGSPTLALANPGNFPFTLILVQGTGGQTVTWFSTLLWPSGTPPTLSTGAGAIDVFVFRPVSPGVYYGFTAGQAMA